MATDNEAVMVGAISQVIGRFAASLSGLEEQILQSISIVSGQREEDPDNTAIPIMMKLLVSAKDMIDAHKTIERVADLMMSGNMMHEEPDTIM